MTTTPPLNGRIIVQAERATRAVLDAHLAKSNTSFMTWIPLNFIATDGPTSVDAVVDQLRTGLRVPRSEARAAVEDLVAAGLVTVTDTVSLTDLGRSTHQEINVGISELTRRLYDGLPQDELLIARHILETLTDRARAELATAS